MKLLLAEDDKKMSRTLSELLRLENYDVDCAYNGEDALFAMQTGIYDAVVMDVMMPVMNGFEAVSKARKAGVGTPVIMLTAKSDVDDKVTGLDAGADDYLTKPFQTKELLARLRALCRRGSDTQTSDLSFGDIRLDPGSFSLECVRNARSVRLGEKEYRILEYMIANKGQILTREQLALRIWGYESEAEYNNVEVYMSFTRKKLAFVEAKTALKAVRGVGYELRCEE